TWSQVGGVHAVCAPSSPSAVSVSALSAVTWSSATFVALLRMDSADSSLGDSTSVGVSIGMLPTININVRRTHVVPDTRPSGSGTQSHPSPYGGVETRLRTA